MFLDAAMSRNQAQLLNKFERTLEGGYGYSAVGPAPVTSVKSGGQCECPMCYHSVHNPCSSCGCPSTSNKEDKVRKEASKQRNVSQGSTSDYSSLSPASPDLTSHSSSSREGNLDNTEESNSQRSTSPESKDLTERSSSPSSESKDDTKDSGNASQEDLKEDKHSESNSDETELRTDTVQPEVTYQENTWVRDTKLRSNPRRHSWAGGRLSNVGMPKQTSLQDFKKLLAQKTPSQSQQKASAVEMLKSSRGDAAEPFYSSQIAGGSFRKKVTPRRDHKFDAIEEQEETEANKEDAALQPEPWKLH